MSNYVYESLLRNDADGVIFCSFGVTREEIINNTKPFRKVSKKELEQMRVLPRSNRFYYKNLNDGGIRLL